MRIQSIRGCSEFQGNFPPPDGDLSDALHARPQLRRIVGQPALDAKCVAAGSRLGDRRDLVDDERQIEVRQGGDDKLAGLAGLDQADVAFVDVEDDAIGVERRDLE